MARTVVPIRMVAHLWANKSQASARTGRESMFFEGDTIYSYGSHFPIARHVKNKNGTAAILFTTKSYSVTTAGHCSSVRQAIPSGVPVFYVENPLKRPSEHLATIKPEIDRLVLGFVRRRKKDQALRELEQFISYANEFAAFFGLKKRFALPKGFDLDKIKKPKALREGDRANFSTLLLAAQCKDLALVSAIRKSDGAQVALVCAMSSGDEPGDICPVPLAVMIEGNPFELFEDPTIL